MNQIPKCTLVPAHFCDEKEPRCFLSEVAVLSDDEQVNCAPVPEFGAVLVYAGSEAPELLNVLHNLNRCHEYNKVLASYKDGWLHLAIARGSSLLFANVFKAEAFSTAEYFIFNVMKSLQLNLEMSTVCFLSDLTEEEEMSLYRYVKMVDRI